MLLFFAYTGAIVSMLFMFITSKVYYLAPFLVIIGVTCLGCSFTLLNAFLPLLVSHHQENNKDVPEAPPDYELEALNSESSYVRRSDPDKLARDLERSAKISSKGVGLGYAAAVSFQIFSIIFLTIFGNNPSAKKDSTLLMRIILLLVGLWWAIFTLPTLLWLRPRPGPPLPQSSKPAFSARKQRDILFYPLFSLRSFWATLKRAVHLRQVLVFLTAWFLLSDAIATISG
jgi:MFS transporter, UMF1 family